MIATSTFTHFARRQAALRDCPYIVIAETPNPIRQLDPASMGARAEAMLDTIVWGLTQPAEEVQRHNQELAKKHLRPAGVFRASQPV